MQSRKESVIETCVNIAIGYSVAVLSQVVIFPLVEVEATIKQNLTIGVYFTAISFIRSYCIRRVFNRVRK